MSEQTESILYISNKEICVFRIDKDGSLWTTREGELKKIEEYSDITIAFGEALKVMSEINIDQEKIRNNSIASAFKELLNKKCKVFIPGLECENEVVLVEDFDFYIMDNNINIE